MLIEERFALIQAIAQTHEPLDCRRIDARFGFRKRRILCRLVGCEDASVEKDAEREQKNESENAVGEEPERASQVRPKLLCGSTRNMRNERCWYRGRKSHFVVSIRYLYKYRALQLCKTPYHF